MSGSVDVPPLPVVKNRKRILKKRSHSHAENVFADNINRQKRKRQNELQTLGKCHTENAGDEKEAAEVKFLHCKGNTPKHRDNVVVCSEKYETESNKYAQNLRSKGQAATVLVCKGCDTFSDEIISMDRPLVMFLVVDTDLLSIMLDRKSIVQKVDNFFEAFAESGGQVHLVNKMADDHRFMVLFYQLPEGCAKIYKEITVSFSTEGEPTPDEDDTPVKQRLHESVHPDDINGNETLDILDNSHAQDVLSEQTVGKQLIQPAEQDTDSVATENSRECLQVGSHCKMNISAGPKQLIIAKQDGRQNIVNINIGPSAPSSKMVVVLTSDPHNPQLEELLVTELNNKTDLVNISLKSHDTSIIGVRRGSVIIEMEVEQGRELSEDWVCQVLQTILQDTLTPGVLGGTRLDVSIDLMTIIPKDRLGEYVLLRDPEKKHQTCVERRKYEDLVTELEKTKEKLTETGLEGETINVINQKLSSGGSLLLVHPLMTNVLDPARHTSVNVYNAAVMASLPSRLKCHDCIWT